MGRLANISGKQAVKAFERAGGQSIGQVGSHLVMVKPGVNANLLVPQHRELSVGTLRSLIKYSGPLLELLLIFCQFWYATINLLHTLRSF